MHSGPMVDMIADYIAIFVLFFVPALLIYIFWMIHILPEKIAHQRNHPQADAIQTLCLLSLVFGGMLWPIAWLWAYSKPVLYKMAYGTDRIEHAPDGVLHDAPHDLAHAVAHDSPASDSASHVADAPAPHAAGGRS